VSREADIRPPRIVIIGGGFAGVYCAQELERRLRPDEAEVVLVDRNNYFIFYPLLVEAGTGSLEPRHAVVSIRSFIDRTRFMMGSVIGGDLDAGTLRIARPDGESETVLEFDHLVVAPGSITRLPPVPGLKDHGFEIKSLNDAVTLRDRAIGLLEQADCAPDAETRRRLLHFVVVGANFTGVEIAGEMGIFLHRAAKQFRNIKPSDIRVSMVELGQRILPAPGRGSLLVCPQAPDATRHGHPAGNLGLRGGGGQRRALRAAGASGHRNGHLVCGASLRVQSSTPWRFPPMPLATRSAIGTSGSMGATPSGPSAILRSISMRTASPTRRPPNTPRVRGPMRRRTSSGRSAVNRPGRATSSIAAPSPPSDAGPAWPRSSD
jgi:hypothetical protein